jgi:hypothetical protein
MLSNPNAKICGVVFQLDRYEKRNKTYLISARKPLYEYKIDNIDSIFDEKINQNLMGMTTFNHLNFNKTELKVIISLFKKLKSLSVDEQINLLFGKNNTEVQQETQTQTQINTQINNEMNKNYDLDF